MSKKTAHTEVAEPITAALPEVPVAEAAEQTAEKESVVYLGPSIDRTVNHGTVFKAGELPAYLEAKIRQVPAIRGLIVPISRYAEVAREITLPTGRYRTLYDTVKNSK